MVGCCLLVGVDAMSVACPFRGAPVDDFAVFYRDNRAKVVGRAYLLTRSNAAAEDLAQDAFVALQRHWGRVSDPHAYLRTILINGCKRWAWRAQLARERQPPATDGVADLDVDEMWDALASLSRDQHTTIVLRFYEDLSQEEIAALMQVPVGTVKSRLNRGLRHLKEMLEP